MKLKAFLINTFILSIIGLSTTNAATALINEPPAGDVPYHLKEEFFSDDEVGYEPDDEETRSQRSTSTYDERSYDSDFEFEEEIEEQPEEELTEPDDSYYLTDKELTLAESFEETLFKKKLGGKKIPKSKKTLGKAQSNKARKAVRNRLAEVDKRDSRKEISCRKRRKAKSHQFLTN